MEKKDESDKKGIRIGTLPGVLIILAVMIVYVLLSVRVVPQRDYMQKVFHARAKATLQKIHAAQAYYHKRWHVFGTVKELRAEKMIEFVFEDEDCIDTDSVMWTQGNKDMYNFGITVTRENWQAAAWPEKPGETGKLKFRISIDGEMEQAPCMSEEDIPSGSATSSSFWDW